MSGEGKRELAGCNFHRISYSFINLRRCFIATCLVLAVSLLAMPRAAEATRRYVSPDGLGNCTSWSAACSLMTAVNQSNPGDEVWVKRGTYNIPYLCPSCAEISPGTWVDVTAVLVLRNGVAIYGGFVGSETLRSQRNWLANATYLDGWNQHRGVFAQDVGSSAILDGFIIQYGLLIDDPDGLNGGAGMWTNDSSPTLNNLIFHHNISYYAEGGALLNKGGSPVLTNVLMADNMSWVNGSAVWNWYGEGARLINATIYGNTMGMHNGFCVYGGSLVNSIVWGNTHNDGETHDQVFDTTVSFSDIQGGYLGFYTISSDPLFVNAPGGDFHLSSGSPAIDRGDVAGLPADSKDWDNDSNTTEPIPYDLGRGTRVINTLVDMGAYEATSGGSSTNNAPVLNSGTPTLTAINEDDTGSAGTRVMDIISSVSNLITDADPGAVKGLAITGGNTNGHWEFSLDGSNWRDVGSVTDAAARTLAADSTTRLRFSPAANYHGSSGFNFRAWDQTAGVNGGSIDCTVNGGTTSVSSATGTATIAINAVNDAPALSAIDPQGVVVGHTLTGIDFTVDDDLDPPGVSSLDSLVLSAVSSDTSVVPNSSLVLGGSGSNRTISITPAPTQTGVTYITITASDTNLTGTTTFELTVSNGIRYVAESGLTSGNCDTWANACELWYAFQVALSGDEFWVKAGTYSPQGAGNNGFCEYGTFNVPSNFSMYGGFIGTETARSERAPWANSTLLDGSGTPTYPACHVVKIQGKSNVVIDGFEILNGHASDNGGGAYLVSSNTNIRLANLRVHDNFASNGAGGGIYMSGGSAKLTNVVMENNYGRYGGGMYMTGGSGSSRLVNVSFKNNHTGTTHNSGQGGGLYVDSGTVELTNDSFYSNQADVAGSGLYINSGTVTLRNTTFSSNHNWANSTGGSIYQNSGTLSVYNSILWGNDPAVFNGSLDIQASNNETSNPLFVGGDDLRLQQGSPSIDAGNNTYLPTDTNDLDGDGNTGETLPYDGNNGTRVGNGTVDQGAYELVTWYVKENGPGSGCTSWADACPSLKTALGKAHGMDRIWVAAGTYKPAGTPRYFSVTSSNQIYGGFAGNELFVSERDFVANVTVLSGDMNGSGVPDSGDAIHVVYFTGDSNAGRLDGFTVTGGYNGGYNGAGVDVYRYAKPTLANLTVTGNIAGGSGGGIGIESYSAPTLASITVSNNSAVNLGGGIASFSNSSPTMSNIILTNNSSSGTGGGIYLGGSGSLSNSTFTSNTATTYGGGIALYDQGTVSNATFNANSALYGGAIAVRNGFDRTLENLTIVSNTVTNAGGGIWINSGTLHTTTLRNLTITDNSATTRGGGIENNGSYVYMVNAILWGNSAPTGPNVDQSGSYSWEIYYCDIQNGATCATCIYTDPLLATMGNYGGPTLTRAPIPNSPVINTGGDGSWCAATDQRGVSRPQASRCDMGAVESSGFSYLKVSGDNQDTLINTAFPLPLVLQVAENNAPLPGVQVSFTAPSSGAGATPTTANLTTGADGLVSLAMTANGATGQYNVTAGPTSFTLTNKLNTNTALISSLNPSTGQPVTFTATVTASSGTPTGTVSFANGGTTICSAVSLNGSGVATCLCPVTALSVGANSITAVYSGSIPYYSSSGSLTQDYDKYPTTTGLGSSANPSLGEPVTFTATVDSTGGGTPNGTVTFKDGAATMCNAVTLNGSGQAQCVNSMSVGGDHSISATYNGTAAYYGSGANLTQTVNCLTGPIVTNANDSGSGSLRQAVYSVCGGDTITFNGDYTIRLGATINIIKSLTIDGTGHTITISGDTDNNGTGDVQILTVNGGVTLSLNHLTLTRGNSAGSGGAISSSGTVQATDVSFTYNSAVNAGAINSNNGTLNLYNSSFDGNSLATGSSGFGGAIYGFGGALTMAGVTFSGNSAADGMGGAVLLDDVVASLTDVTFANNTASEAGGLAASGNVTLTNVTFSGNSSGWCGGMENWGTASLTNVTFSNNNGYAGGLLNGGTLTLNHGTFSGNTGTDFGGGLYNYSGAGTTQVRNTIFWGNSAPNGAQIYYDTGYAPTISDSVVQGGYPGGTNIITASPALGTLSSNGGYTQTIPIGGASSALDTANATYCPGTDQRGISRPQACGCDIGAYELTPIAWGAVNPLKLYKYDADSDGVDDIQLTWNAVNGATRYRVWSSSAPNSGFSVLLPDVTVTHAEDINALSGGGSKYYLVFAY